MSDDDALADSAAGRTWATLQPVDEDSMASVCIPPAVFEDLFTPLEPWLEHVGFGPNSHDPQPQLLTSLAIGASDRSTLDLNWIPVNGQPTLLTRATFETPHPDAWWHRAHELQQVLLAVVDPEPFVLSDDDSLWAKHLAGIPIGVAPLVVYAWGDGVGTRRP